MLGELNPKGGVSSPHAVVLITSVGYTVRSISLLRTNVVHGRWIDKIKFLSLALIQQALSYAACAQGVLHFFKKAVSLYFPRSCF